MERFLHRGEGQEQRPRPADKSAESLALIERYGMIVLGVHQAKAAAPASIVR